MNSVVEFFEKLLTNFTWSRLTFTFALLILGICGVFGYEAYTQHFALGRLSEQVRIFDQLVKVSEKIDLHEKDQLINETYKKLMSAFNSQVEYKQFVYPQLPEVSNESNEESGRENPPDDISTVNKYSFPEWFTKSIYILLPWFILSLVVLLFGKTPDKGKAMVGMMLIGVIFLAIGMVLPSFKEHPWVMKWLYPWGCMVLVLLLIFASELRKQLKPSD